MPVVPPAGVPPVPVVPPAGVPPVPAAPPVPVVPPVAAGAPVAAAPVAGGAPLMEMGGTGKGVPTSRPAGADGPTPGVPTQPGPQG
ncbi:hypothetical protein [Mycolicibacterium mageritense]|uniref:hypothetical protein n=1 Tax=Mycolicibacterium mageritense TaxID=53462 RepID=UPI003F6832F7